MAWLDKLKLKKGITLSLTEAGYLTPKEIQLKTLPRINGGQDILAVGPEGCGKSTTIILAALNRFNHTPEGVPFVLILVPDKESVLNLLDKFEILKRNKSIEIVGLYAAPGIESQMNALADGADIVVATPDRARALYLKLGLNLNKIDLFIVDDAELIVKQGLQLPVAELANSITKAQRLVFTEVIHEKLNKMIAPFMKLPAIIEIEEIGETIVETHQQVLYHVPNFGTKLNLLNLFMGDDELFTKVIVFVNTRQTAEKVFESLQKRLKNAVSLHSALGDFRLSDEKRILIAINEDVEISDLNDIPFFVHFELPAEKDVYVKRIVKSLADTEEEILSIVFATDLELSTIRKIEQTTGQKIPVAELPEELLIEKERKTKEPKKEIESIGGEAFHEKKPSNSKTYNYGGGAKAKMNNKKKHL